MPGSSSQFRTFQTVQNYEDALSRHGQWLRWTSGITCPCLDTNTFQPNPHCTLCSGRGRIYKSPGKFRLMDERAHHTSFGKVYPLKPPIVDGSAAVYRKGVSLPLAVSQPSDGSYVQLDPPYPKAYQILTLDYEYDPDISVTDEDSTVYDESAFILRTVATRFNEKGKTFEGSIKSVSRVYNVDKAETYIVTAAFKEYVYLAGIGTWESGDVLEVDYLYQMPFDFLLVGITSKMRYEQPYVLEEADAILVTPYWAQVAPDDLLTAMAVEQIGRAIVEPSISGAGNDEITAYYDLSRLLRVIDRSGNEYSTGAGNNVEIFERNELKWNVTKPSTSYVAQFTYHPTYTALNSMHSLRNAENKAFANRVSVKQFDRVHDKVVY